MPVLLLGLGSLAALLDCISPKAGALKLEDDGVVYAGSDDHHLNALDAVDGRLIGEYEKGYFQGLSNYAVPQGVLYFGTFPGGVHAHAAPQPW